MRPPTKLIVTAENALQGGVISQIFSFFMGRCTFFAIVYAIVGIWGWLHNKDLTSYALFGTSLLAFLVTHSWKEDVAEQKAIQQQNIQIINNEPPAPPPSAQGK